MKILLVGGTGHTGERLARRLHHAGHAVTVLSRRNADRDPVLRGLVKFGLKHALGDANRLWTLMEALEGSDALVSCSHIRYAPALVAACEATGVRRYLQMSSTRRFTKYPCTSSREVIAGEAAIEASDLDYTVLRATMIFGGRRDANLTRLVAWFRKHRWFPLFGDGRALTQPVFVEDLVDAMVAALNRPETSARRMFTLAGPEAITYRRMLTETARACGVAWPIFLRIPAGPALLAAELLPEALTRRALTAEQIRRFSEDKDADIRPAAEALGFAPRTYAEAIQLKASGGAEVDKVYK